MPAIGWTIPRAYASRLCYEPGNPREQRRHSMDVRKSQALRDILKDKALLKDKCYVNGKWLSGAARVSIR